jgi:hypothetical protein
MRHVGTCPSCGMSEYTGSIPPCVPASSTAKALSRFTVRLLTAPPAGWQDARVAQRQCSLRSVVVVVLVVLCGWLLQTGTLLGRHVWLVLGGNQQHAAPPQV